MSSKSKSKSKSNNPHHSAGQKRKYLSLSGSGSGNSYSYSNSNSNSSKNPKRGGPGILLTCETGREYKCRFEALDILNHYVRDDTNNGDDSNNSNGDTAKGTQLSLDEELKQLKNNSNPNKKQIFSAYNTGVRGTVTLLCTLPDCALIPPYKPSTSGAGDGDVTKDNDADAVGDTNNNKNSSTDGAASSSPASKKSKHDDNDDEDETPNDSGGDKQALHANEAAPVAVWDPVETVQRIMNDVKDGGGNHAMAPGSRFVTRMIPIQATCFASQEEITHAARHLFQRHAVAATGACIATATTTNKEKDEEDDSQKPPTFAIQVKRRICGHLKSSNVIEWVAKEAPSHWTVHLSNPRYTVWIEICKTLCCMSIMERVKERFGNFNIQELREQKQQEQQQQEEEEEAKEAAQQKQQRKKEDAP